MYTIPLKKKTRKVRHVVEVTAPEHGHRQCQEQERSITPDGGEIDDVSDRIALMLKRWCMPLLLFRILLKDGGQALSSLLRMELGENTPITWEKFKEVFNETYFPDV